MATPAVARQPLSLRILASSRRFIRWLTRPHVALSLIMLPLMFYMIIIPLFRMVETTVTFQAQDVARVQGAVEGELTSFHYVRMLTGTLGKIFMYTPLQHSFTIAAGATLLALAIGGSLAWLVIRTDMPGRKLVNQLALIPYIMPSWTLAQARLVFFKGRLSGRTPGVFEAVMGYSPPIWLSYGPLPIIICSALHYYAFFFLFVSAALMSIDSNLEEAGDLMGASRWRILRRITFPLVIPAILSGFIMTFSKVMGTFGGPNILGTPVRYYVVATMIRGSMGVGDVADAFVLAIVLILFSVVFISLNQRVIGTRKSYETIGGRGFVAQVDARLGQVVDAALAAGYMTLVTADHGNLEEMIRPDGTPHVSHTANLVPFILIDPRGQSRANVREGKLADIAPTVLRALELAPADAMSCEPLAPDHDWGGRRRVLLLILDGWGIGKDDDTNPIWLAPTPVWDDLTWRHPCARLQAAGEAVGLRPGKPGNSEAGHMNMGAGRVVLQDDVRLDLALRDGSFYRNGILCRAIDEVRRRDTSLHLIGLLSEKSSHGSIDYPLALLRMAAANSLRQVYLHLILDGRSTEPGSAPAMLEKLESQVQEIGVGQIVTGVGRGIALGRDGDYDKTRRTYDALAFGVGKPYGAH